MLNRILSATGTALGKLWDLIAKHPKQSLVVFWVIVVTGFGAWRLQQPFDQIQPLLFAFGLVAILIGGISLWLERRDPQGSRFKAVFMSIAAMGIGLFMGYLGIRLV